MLYNDYDKCFVENIQILNKYGGDRVNKWNKFLNQESSFKNWY